MVTSTHDRANQVKGLGDHLRCHNKRYAQVKVVHTVISRIEEGMRRIGLEAPPSRGPTSILWCDPSVATASMSRDPDSGER
jgi:hypothetical protein